MTDDIDWLKDRLHENNCRQCDIVRALIVKVESNDD